MTETLKLFFNLRPWQTLTTQKLSEKLYLSVPTMLKLLKECEEWLKQYHIILVNERGKGYRLKSKENEWKYRFTDESFYKILIYCCLAYKRKELEIPLVSDYYQEELKILKKYTEYAYTVAILRNWRRCSMYTSCQRISYSCPFKSCVLNSLVFQK